MKLSYLVVSMTVVLASASSRGALAQEGPAAAPGDAAPVDPMGAAIAALETQMRRVQIHGFGNWAYGITDSNYYAVGTPDGSAENFVFSLALRAEPMEGLSIAAQPSYELENGDFEASIDYAFVEWALADALRLKAGAVKQPFGIYTEIFDVGTLRPFATLPQSIYAGMGVVSESYLGVAVAGGLHGASGWGIQYDLYGGALTVETGLDLDEVIAATGEEEELERRLRNVVGARLVLQTPLPALRLGVSGYTAERVEEEDELLEGEEERYSAAGAHLEYQGDALLVRIEYARLMSEETVDAAYAEIAYRILEPLQVGLRLEWVQEDSILDLSVAPSLADHREAAVTVNYWLSRSFVVKLSYHYIDGNRLANPGEEELREEFAALAPGERLDLDEVTQLWALGVGFTF